jgi:hypothetical protein
MSEGNQKDNLAERPEILKVYTGKSMKGLDGGKSHEHAGGFFADRLVLDSSSGLADCEFIRGILARRGCRADW